MLIINLGLLSFHENAAVIQPGETLSEESGEVALFLLTFVESHMLHINQEDSKALLQKLKPLCMERMLNFEKLLYFSKDMFLFGLFRAHGKT